MRRELPPMPTFTLLDCRHSHRVQLMLGIEEAFDLEFPDHLLNRKSFASIEAIERTVRQILEDRKVA